MRLNLDPNGAITLKQNNIINIYHKMKSQKFKSGTMFYANTQKYLFW